MDWPDPDWAKGWLETGRMEGHVEGREEGLTEGLEKESRERSNGRLRENAGGISEGTVPSGGIEI